MGKLLKDPEPDRNNLLTKGEKEKIYDRIGLSTKQLDIIILLLVVAAVVVLILGVMKGNGVF